MNRMQRTKPQAGFLSKGYFPCIIAACITELESVRSFMQKASAFVSEEQKRFRDRLGTEIEDENMGGHQADALYDAHYAEMNDLHSYFPMALRCSMLTFAFSVFESKLVEACKYLDKHPFKKSASLSDDKKIEA